MSDRPFPWAVGAVVHRITLDFPSLQPNENLTCDQAFFLFCFFFFTLFFSKGGRGEKEKNWFATISTILSLKQTTLSLPHAQSRRFPLPVSPSSILARQPLPWNHFFWLAPILCCFQRPRWRETLYSSSFSLQNSPYLWARASQAEVLKFKQTEKGSK